MLDALFALLIVYLALAYAFGGYLAVRALMGRRLRQVIKGAPARRIVRPLSQPEPAPEPTPPAPAQAMDRPRIAA